MSTVWLSAKFLPVIRAVMLMAAGIIVAKIAATATRRLAAKRLSAHHAQLTRRVIFYTTLALFAVMALHQLGFDLSVLLGAAGIFSVAIGFASQTSASNLISGLFLIAERPFVVGDAIKVGDTVGEVLAIDLLSVKLRTFDNLFVRVPNESLIKSQITNLSRFPVRRLDLQIGVAYKEDMARVRDTLLAVAEANPLCLIEPAPLFIFNGFGDSALELQFSVWAKRENFLALKNAMQMEIKQAFDAADIDIPYPHRTLHTNGQGEPLPIRIVRD